MADQDILGRGWSFPVRPGPDGGLALIGGEEKVRQSIWLILSTAPGERQMRPDFGCGIHDLVFQPITASLQDVVADRVQTALVDFEPRIDVLGVDVSSPPEAPNYLLIRVDYRIRSSNSLYNLVYPFFIAEGAG
jgi:uncharacterized protein